MLFVTLGRPKPGSTLKHRLARRAEWKYPPGVKVLGEYWLELADLTFVAIMEADDAAPIMAARAEWDEDYDFTTTPAISAEQGMGLAEELAKH